MKTFLIMVLSNYSEACAQDYGNFEWEVRNKPLYKVELWG